MCGKEGPYCSRGDAALLEMRTINITLTHIGGGRTEVLLPPLSVLCRAQPAERNRNHGNEKHRQTHNQETLDCTTS
jgi:hypothetical protein